MTRFAGPDHSLGYSSSYDDQHVRRDVTACSTVRLAVLSQIVDLRGVFPTTLTFDVDIPSSSFIPGNSVLSNTEVLVTITDRQTGTLINFQAIIGGGHGSAVNDLALDTLTTNGGAGGKVVVVTFTWASMSQGSPGSGTVIRIDDVRFTYPE